MKPGPSSRNNPLLPILSLAAEAFSQLASCVDLLVADSMALPLARRGTPKTETEESTASHRKIVPQCNHSTRLLGTPGALHCALLFWPSSRSLAYVSNDEVEKRGARREKKACTFSSGNSSSRMRCSNLSRSQYGHGKEK